mgnify:CR=1 FL=1
MGEDELLSRAISRLTEKFRVKAVILFGSRSRGDWGSWSGYDLLIIAEFSEKYLDRVKSTLECLKDVRLPIEPHPYTLSEALDMLRRGNPAVVDALEEGRVLYADEELKVLKDVYVESKRRG